MSEVLMNTNQEPLPEKPLRELGKKLTSREKRELSVSISKYKYIG